MTRHRLGWWWLRGAGICILIILLVPWIGLTSESGSRAPRKKQSISSDSKISPSAIELTSEEKAWLEEHPRLRLGVDPAWPPYEFIDANGRYSGIAADYVALIRERLGIDMDVQPGLRWDQVLTKLENKELDVAPAVTQTPERNRFLLFTQPHVKYSVAIVTQLAHSNVDSLAALAGRKVALVKGYAFTEIALASQPDISPLYVDTVLEGLNKVSSGEADAIVSDLPSLSYKISEYNFLNLKVAGTAPFQTDGLRIAIRNDWPILASILEKALASITPEEHQEIRTRWISFRAAEGSSIDLSAEERKWLASHPVIRNAADPAWAPIEFLDAEGRLSGITSEYLTRLEEMLHVKFETPRDMTWAQMMDALKDGRLDMASCVRDTPQRRSFLEFTEPYFSMSTAIFASITVSYVDLPSLRGKRVAVVQSYALQDLIGGEYPEIELVPVTNIEQGLGMLSRGDVHAYVDALAPGIYGLNYYGFKNIHVAGETPFRYQMSMAASKQLPILASILQKAIRAMPEVERNRYFQKWVNVPVAYRQDYSVIWKIFAGAAVLFVIVAYWNRRLAQEVSGRRQVEAALRLAKEELERRVEERTAELEARNVALADEVLERKRAEEALRESESRFIQLFDSAPVPMAFASAVDGYHGTTWNDAWYGAFGYPREVADGRSGNDIGLWVNPEERTHFVEMTNRLNSLAGFEARLRRHDGAVRNCSLFSRFIGTTGDRLLMAVYLDITESKRVEAALRESEERFFKAFSLSPAPMAISEIQTGRFIDVNEQWIRMMEYSREETVGHTCYEQGIWDDLEVRACMVRRLQEAGSFRDEPVCFISKSGKLRDALWSAEKVTLGGTDVMLSLIYDFSERKRAEEALRAKTEELDRFFSLALDLLCIADTDGFFHRLNPQWEVVLGYPVAELEGRRFLDLVHPEDRAPTLEAMSRLVGQESILDFTNRYQCQDGSYRWIEWRSTPAGDLIYAAARDITERKEAEEALRRSEDLLRRSQSVARLGSYSFDVRTGSWVSSSVLDDLFGIDDSFTKDVEGWTALVHPEDQAAMREHLLEQVLIQHNRFEKEYRILRHNDGQERWIHGMGELELDAAGNPVRMIGTIQDITEHKRAEQALHESMQRLQTVVNGAPVVLYSFDRNGVFTLSEGKGLAGLGIRPGEIVGRTIYDVYRDQPEAIAALNRAIAGETFTVEIAFEAGGTFEVSHTAMRDEEGRYAGTIGVLLDITGRKQAEEALRLSEATYREIFNTVNDTLWIHDIESFAFLDVNQKVTEMFGYSVRDALDLTVEELSSNVPPFTQETAAEMLRKAAAGEPQLFEWHSRHKDGHLFWTEVNLKRGTIAGRECILSMERDITQRKRVQDDLRNSLEEKESLLKEVHHRVKNNLQVISSLLQLRARKVRNPEVLGVLRDTQNRVRSMALLHETLYRSGNLARVSLPQYVKNVCTHVARSYASSAPGIRLRHEIADVSLDVDLAIPVGLIINELASNAFKHAFRSRSRGEILVTLLSAPGHQLVLRVSDNGTGLPRDTDLQEGETLGLLLVRNLARQLDGQTRVSGGQGTVFEISFPERALDKE